MFIRDGANPQETGFALFYVIGNCVIAWWSPTRIAADAKEKEGTGKDDTDCWRGLSGKNRVCERAFQRI